MLEGKMWIRMARRGSHKNNERNAKWDCAGNADPVVIEGNKIYSYVGGKMWIRMARRPHKNNERNAEWDCAGNADPVIIEGRDSGSVTEKSVMICLSNNGQLWNNNSLLGFQSGFTFLKFKPVIVDNVQNEKVCNKDISDVPVWTGNKQWFK